MNINAKELLMLDRAKFAKMNNQPVPTTSGEPPVTNPQSGMKALEIQANNNIAFQGGMTQVAQKSVKKLAPMLAAGLFAALASQSCINLVDVEVDNSATNALLSQILDELQKNNELSQATLNLMISESTKNQEMRDFIKAEAEKNDAFRDQVLNALIKDAEVQEALGSKLDTIIQMMKDGDIDAKAALDMILDALKDIKDSVDNVGEKIDSLAANVNAFHQSYLEGKEELLNKIGDVIEVEKANGEKISINGEKLDSLIAINNRMAEDIENIEHETYELLQIAKDPAKFEELMAQLKDNKLDEEEMSQIKAMFEMLGLDITDVINKSTEDLTGAMKDVQTSVENFHKDDVALQKEQIELTNKIFEKLGKFEGKLDELSANQLAEIKILKDQFEALKGIGGDIVDELRDIDAALDGIQATLNFIYEEILSIGDDVEAIKDGQVVIMDAMADGFASLLKEGQIHTAQMDVINTNIVKGNGILANLEQNSKDMIAIAKDPTRHNELIETIKDLKLGDEEYARFEAMFKALGLEMSDVIKMSGSELKAAIEKFNNEYVVLAKEQLEVEKSIADKIDGLSGKVEGLSANQKEALKEIVSQFEALKGDMNKNLDDVVAELRDIDAALDGIQATLNILVEKVTQIGKDVASYKESEAASVEILNKMFANDKVQTDYLYMLAVGQKAMNDNITKLENTTYATYEQVKNNHAEFIEALKNLEPGTPDFTNMEEALKAMGLSINEAIQMNADQLEAALKGFIDTYIATEKEQTALMGELKDAIDNGVKDIISKFPGFKFDTSNLEMAIDSLRNAVKESDANNVLMYQWAVDEYKTALEDLKQTIKEGFEGVSSQMGTMTSWMSGFDNKFNNAIDTIIANMGANTDKIVEQQKYTNNYMQNLNETADEVKEAIKDLANKTAQGDKITLEELDKLWQEHDDANYEKYAKLLGKLGIKIDDATITVVDAIKQIDHKMDLREDYNDELAQITNLLIANNATLAGNAETVARVEEILKNMKVTFQVSVDCECGSGNETYPGDSYEQVEDLFKPQP